MSRNATTKDTRGLPIEKQHIEDTVFIDRAKTHIHKRHTNWKLGNSCTWVRQ